MRVSLSTSISYHPRSRPSPASALRQLAYREDTPLLGPDVDPEGNLLRLLSQYGTYFRLVSGWEVHGPKSVIGTVFETRTVEIACLVTFHTLSISSVIYSMAQLSLAKPVCVN